VAVKGGAGLQMPLAFCYSAGSPQGSRGFGGFTRPKNRGFT
jgi:hypothetical protein